MPTKASEKKSADDLEALLAYLSRTRGFDFRGYKRASLSRRLQKRMQAVGEDSYADYLDFLEVHPDEFPQLFDTMLINVTGFFRDEGAWTALEGHLKKLLERRKGGPPIRIWSAGCASGEEAYTIAMICCELLGPTELAKSVKIYATDLDEAALNQARQAVYNAKSVELVPERLRTKYFSRVGGSFAFNKELRRTVIFGRHDLALDAPISRVDLLSCRNILMYFNGEAQTRILNRLQFALVEEGILFLGKAEMLLTHTNLFTPIDLKLRIFKRTARQPGASRTLGADGILGSANGNGNGNTPGADRARLAQAAFDTLPFAQMIIDSQGRLALVNIRAAAMFGLTIRDIGRPFQDLEMSYRPVDLRSSIDQARAERRNVQLRGVERIGPSGEKSFIDAQVGPLLTDGGTFGGVLLVFNDTTHHHHLQHELRRANVDLESAHEELQSTSEELETTNEELQSTVEELETTNEELQSTNEELETMNEELQSTNEELQTINEELRQRGSELNQVNAFFESILSSVRTGVVVLDGDLVIKAWNSEMEDLWGLRADEVQGKHFLNLDVGIPLDALRTPIRTCLSTDEEGGCVVDCTSRRGKKIQCKVSMSPLHGTGPGGVILLFEEVGPERTAVSTA